MSVRVLISFFIFIIASLTNAQTVDDFPLWGSEWVVSDGQNNGVYRSSLKLAPKDIMKVHFSSDKRSITVCWANCKQRQWNSTAQTLEHIEKEWGSKKLTAKKIRFEDKWVFQASIDQKICYPIDINYQTYNDTLWTAHKQAFLLMDRYGYRSVTIKVGEKETVYSDWQGKLRLERELAEGPAYTTEKPVAFATRAETQDDRDIFDYRVKYGDEEVYIENMESSVKEVAGSRVAYKASRRPVPHVEDANTLVSDQENTDWRQNGYVNEYIRYLDFKTENLGYWQVHLHPVVAYYPRNPYTGEPIKDERLKMDWETAVQKKRESLANTENAELQFYRNPWLDEKASCIVSFQFTGTGQTMTRDEFVWLDAKKAGVNMDYTHIPTKMFNTASGGVKEAIYKQFTESEKEKDLARTIDYRCPGWRVVDKMIGNTVFPKYNKETGAYERDRSINDQIFSYGDCPCYYEEKYAGLTKAQLKQYAFMPLPTCSRKNILDALYFYSIILNDMKDEARVAAVIWEKIERLKALEQRKNDVEFNTLNKEIREKNVSSRDYAAYRDDFVVRLEKAEEAVCPRSWTDAQVIQEIIR
jgi:hypothetical protein